MLAEGVVLHDDYLFHEFMTQVLAQAEKFLFSYISNTAGPPAINTSSMRAIVDPTHSKISLQLINLIY